MTRRPPFAVVYYSDGRVPEALRRHCLGLLVREAAGAGGEVIAVTWDPVDIDGCREVRWSIREASYRNLYQQILAGIGETSAATILLAEHDVLYPPGYHTVMVQSAARALCYNTNVWRLNARGFFQTPRLRRLLSNCAGPRSALADAIATKLSEVAIPGALRCVEPAGREVSTPLPTVDIRHGMNFTGDREPPDGVYLRRIEHWGHYARYVRLM